jgi:excisionase family DNA binding protein
MSISFTGLGKSVAGVEKEGERIMREFLSIEELAELLGVSIRTVQDWNYKGRGPAITRVGRHVRYTRKAVDEWVVANTEPVGR